MEQTSNFDLSRVIDDAKKVITQPVDFYRGMPKTGGYAEPLIFVLVMALATGIVLTFFSFFGGGRMGGMSMGWAAVIMLPIMALLGSFIGAAIMFVIWKLMGSEQSYETAFRCVAYATAIYPITAVISLVPYLGTIIAVVWVTYLMVIASTEVHNRARNTALIVFGILGLLMLMFNISGEMAARRFESQLEHMGQSMQNLEDMSPEEAGKAMGEFLKGMEKGMQKEQ